MQTPPPLLSPTVLVPFGAAILSYPLSTVIQRYRMQYTPNNHKDNNKLIPNLRTIFTSVWRREGLSGLYKGALLVLPSATIAGAAHGIFGARILPLLPSWLTQAGNFSRMLGLAASALTLTITELLLFEIPSTRLAASSQDFPVIAPISNFKRLFSAEERSHPFKYLLTSSRMLAVILPKIASYLVYWFIPGDVPLAGYTMQQTRIILLLVNLALCVSTTPLCVLADRLNIQRADDSVDTTTGTKGAPTVTTYAQETSVPIRDKPYRTLKSCYQAVVREEGYSTLFRGWPVDLASVAVSGIWNLLQ